MPQSAEHELIELRDTLPQLAPIYRLNDGVEITTAPEGPRAGLSARA